MERRNERGFALPAAVFALVVVGVLVTGGFYMANQETRIGMASAQSARAFYVAEQAAQAVMADWSYSTMDNWDTVQVYDTTSSGTAEVRIARMSDELFFISSEGTASSGGDRYAGATRRIGVLSRLTIPNLNPPAALTTQGTLQIGGSSEIYGQDSIPASWAGHCDPSTLTDMPGILVDDTLAIKTTGSNYVMEGDPAVAQDTTISTESLLDFGDTGWGDIIAMADKVYEGGSNVTNTAPATLVDAMDGAVTCDTSVKANWGDPLNPLGECFTYFPIIYAKGNLSINSSTSGQGILLVEGDLSIAGGFTFYGPVIVRGTLKTTGTGGHVNGGVIAANVSLDTSTVLGNALVQFSSCSVERALVNNNALTKVRPVAMRSWVDLSNAGN